MQTQLQTFTFALGEIAHAIRVVLKDGAPWFVAADVCRALDIANPRDAVSRLDDDEVNTVDSTDGIHLGALRRNLI